MRRSTSSWPPVTRRGRGGSSKAAFGAQARAMTSAERFVGTGAGPVWAETAVAIAAKQTTVSPGLVIQCSDKLLSLQLFDAPPGLDEIFARLEFAQQALEVGQCLGFLIGSGQTFRQIVVHAVPPGEF